MKRLVLPIALTIAHDPQDALLRAIADRVAHLTKDPSKTELEYTHYSVIQDKERRCPMITAANVDGSQYFEIERDGTWVFDGRIPREYQLGNEAYKNNPIDKGHMTRRKDPMWGDQQTASRGSADTFVYTNCALQHSELNQHEWLDLENFILNRAVENKQKVSVFTGPVLNENDPSFNNKGKVSPPTQMPMAFWKVAVWNEPGQGLKGEAYVMSQKDIIGHGDAQPTDFHMTKAEEFAKYRVSLQDLEKMTSIHFGPIKNA